MSDEMAETNFPPPSNAADRICAKGAELLDQDVWDYLGDDYSRVRGVTIRHKGNSVLVPLPKSDDTTLTVQQASKAYEQRFMEARSGARTRETERLIKPVEARIMAEPEPPTPPAPLPPGLLERIMLWMTDEPKKETDDADA